MYTKVALSSPSITTFLLRRNLWGKITRSWNPSTPYEKFKFTGKELDTETDYPYFRARYYDSFKAQWTSPDPLEDKYPGWSSYNYCLENPVKFFDPDGRIVDDSQVKDDQAYIDFISTEEGKKYISQFQEGGDFEDVLLIFEKVENLTDKSGFIPLNGQCIAKTLTEEGKWDRGSSKDFSKMMFTIQINPQNKNGHIGRANTYLHEVQHAVDDMEAIVDPQRGQINFQRTWYEQHARLDTKEWYQDRLNMLKKSKLMAKNERERIF